MKKLLSTILTLVILLSIVPFGAVTVGAEATSGTTGECTWSLDGTVLTISGNGETEDYSIYSSLPWGTLITQVVIGDGVKSIGYGAFNECTSLVNVTIGNDVESIGDYAFYKCSSLTSIIFPDSVTSIGNSAFNDCDSLISVTIGNGVKSIGYSAFYNCTSLTSVTIPDSVTSIGAWAFCNCKSLASITIPDSVEIIGAVAFGDTAYYKNELNWDNDVLYIDNHLIGAKTSLSGDYQIKSGTKTIGSSAFYDCESLTNVTIPNSVISIGENAFCECTSITSINIPDSVESIGSGAFAFCSNLETITISDSVTSIGGDPFYDTAYYNDNSNWDNDVLYIDNHLIKAKTSLSGDYQISSGVKNIAGYAFDKCASLTSITIPDSVVSIGDSAFYECTSLVSITIPDSVMSIGEWAFAICDNLKSVYITDLAAWCNIDFENFGSSPLNNLGNLYINGNIVTDIVIPDSVTCIGDYVFSGYYHLKSVTVHNGVTSIGNDAFADCSIENVYITDLAAWCNIEFENSGSNPLNYGGLNNCCNLYINGDIVTNIIIPDSVISIGNYVFCNYDNLTSVTIPDTVTSIGRSTFANCDSLENITIHKEVISIRKNAFDSSVLVYCYKNSEADRFSKNNGNEIIYLDATDDESIISGTFDNINWSIDKRTGKLSISGNGDMTDFSTKDIPWYDYGKYILSIELSNTITKIGARAFYNLNKVQNITISNSVTTIGDFAFYKCSSLTSVKIPNSVTSIGDGAFSYCENLTNVKLPDNVTSIGMEVFYDCNNLTSITIPDSVTSIGTSVFENCDNLKSVIIGNGVKSIGYYAFYKCSNLTSIIIPDSVTSIGGDAFEECTSLAKVTIGNNVESIGYRAFYNCTSLASVNIPESVTSIDTSAFYNCSSLTDITLPYNIICVTYGIFIGCDELKEVVIYNKHCEFDLECGFNQDNTIYGFVGSTAESFAEEIGADFVDIMTIHTHTFDNGVTTKEPTCKENGVFTYTCTVCRETKIEPIEKLTTHTWKDATCTEPATCKVCGETEGEPNEHVYKILKKNEIEHWNECVCGKQEFEYRFGHSYSRVYDDSEHWLECYCGAKAEQEPHNFNRDAWDETHHWKECFCGIAKVESKQEHNFDGFFILTDKLHCSSCVCGANDFDSVKEHTYSNGCDTTCNDCGCSHEFLGHIYSHGCDTTCNECGETRIADHVYDKEVVKDEYKVSNADCTKSAVYNKSCVCGEKGTATFASGKALGHTFDKQVATAKYKKSNATCTKAAVYYKSCKCGVKGTATFTYGKALGHSNTKITVKKATTKANGYTLVECSKCGTDYKKTTIYYAKKFKLSTSEYTYNGKVKKPTVTVTNSAGKNLKNGTDYTVTYKNNKKVGKATVTISFKGNYAGTKTLSFTIVPKETKVSSVTAAKKSLKVKIKKQSSQTTGYQIQYSTSSKFKSAKTKTIKSYKTTSYTIKSLKAKKTYYVRVRTYKTVNGKKYYSDWSKAVKKKTK